MLIKKEIALLTVLGALILVMSCSSTRAVKQSPAPAAPPQKSLMAKSEKERSSAPRSRTVSEQSLPAEMSTQTAAQQKPAPATASTKKSEHLEIVGKTAKQASPAQLPATAEKAGTAESPGKQKLSLDFDDADIYEVINALADILNINYIIDPSVKGKVNIHTSGEIDKSQIFPILETIFKVNNIAAVKEGNLYKIIPIKDAKATISQLTQELEQQPSGDRVIIQIVPLSYIPSAEIIKVLKPFVSTGGDLQEYSKGNIVIIVDTASNVKKLLGLIDIIDVDTFEQMQVRFYPIKNADVKDLAKELESLFVSLGFSKSTEKGLGISFIPIERVNYILAVSSVPGIFDKVEHWVKGLDAVDIGAEEQVFIYFLENAKAEDLASVLSNLYGEGKGVEKSATPAKRTSTESKSTRSRKSRESTTPTKKEGGGGVKGIEGTLQGPIKIVTDETTNSLIIRAIPSDYTAIKATIQKLDVVPKQVLIEVLIAEVTLGGDTEFGVEWALRSADASLGGYKGESKAEMTFGIGGLGSDLATNLNKGFAYRFNANRLQTFLIAQASKNRLNILSSPHILAADNKEAKIEVGEEVPIVTSEYLPLQAQQIETTSRSIEYRSTGVILTVTPRINDKGLVAMEISQEVSEAQPVVAGGIQSPTITNRKAQTTLVVDNGMTIIIGGLIGNKSSKTISGVPLLSSIPLLGYLFSDTKNTVKKTELIILITPYVVTNFNEANLLTKEFKDKVEQVKKMIQKSEDKWAEDYK